MHRKLSLVIGLCMQNLSVLLSTAEASETLFCFSLFFFFFFHGLPPSVRIIRFRLSQGTLDPSAAQSNLTQGLRRGGGRKSCKQALDSQSAFSTVQRSSYAADLLACLPAPREGLSGLDEASVVTLVDCWCFKSSAKPHAVLLNARSPQFFLG